MTGQWNAEEILNLSGGFLKPRILLTAAELNLFSKLGPKPLAAREICIQEGWDERGLTILLDALTAMGLLTKSEDGRFRPAESLAGLLDEGTDNSVLPMALHRVRLWQSWSNLTQIVRTGVNPSAGEKASRSEEDVEAFIGAMHVVGKMTAHRIADSVDLSNFTRMLDVGGGPGTYTVAFLQKAPQMTATLFDLPPVVEIARKRLAESGFIDRVSLVPGDYTKDPLPEGHDLVVLSAVIHSNGREANQGLLARVHAALTPGGVVLIRDYIMDSMRTFPPEGAIFAVNMLAATDAGTCYTMAEVTEDLEAAGFRNITMIREGERMDQVVSAVK
jgi:predicted O-methyltransferase YrrM